MPNCNTVASTTILNRRCVMELVTPPPPLQTYHQFVEYIDTKVAQSLRAKLLSRICCANAEGWHCIFLMYQHEDMFIFTEMFCGSESECDYSIDDYGEHITNAWKQSFVSTNKLDVESYYRTRLRVCTLRDGDTVNLYVVT